MPFSIRTDKATRILYATDASIYRCEPSGVFFPRDEEELTAFVKHAGKEGKTLLPRGAGTSLSGQAITSGVAIDLTAFTSLRIEGNRAIVGPGVVIDEIDRAALPLGLRFGPTPASSNRATIGGLLANNGTGARSIKFGMASDSLLSARVLFSDGSIRTFRRGDLDPADRLTREVLAAANPVKDHEKWPKTWRNASGLDIRGMYKHSSLLPLLCGSEGSLGIILEAEIALFPKAQSSRLAIFFYDDLVTAMRDVPRLLATNPSAIELMDEHLLRLAHSSKKFRMRVISSTPPALFIVEYEDTTFRPDGAAMIIDDPADQADVWNTRKEGLGILMSTRAERRPLPFIEDCAVPVEKLPEYVTRLSEIIHRHGTEGAYYAHASAGCLHIRPLLDLRREDERVRMDSITEETVDLLAELGGTLTGEHGDGRSKTPYLERIFGREIVGAFEKIRAAFDAIGTFKPAGKTELRVERPARESWMKVEVDRCNGEAACRKKTGVMCPSFQVTGDEFLSTRGRANLLRAWIEGEDIEDDVAATLSKCLACKACSAECPSQVDMALLKAEFVHRRGPTLRDRFYGNYAALSEFGRRIGWTPRRFPKPQPKRIWPRVADPLDGYLFIDTHMEYFEQNITASALRLFEAMNLRVQPIRAGCCGRPAFSRGLLDKAKNQIEAIKIDGDHPVIVVEPSCLSRFEESGIMKDRIVSIESFILDRAERIRKIARAREIIFHSHCHQKASGRSSEARRLLELAGRVKEIDAGCCGMAGSFGYEHRHLSLAIAEDRFLPGLRHNAIRAASGRSCREMAARGGLSARHPIEVLADRLAPDQK